MNKIVFSILLFMAKPWASYLILVSAFTGLFLFGRRESRKNRINFRFFALSVFSSSI